MSPCPQLSWGNRDSQRTAAFPSIHSKKVIKSGMKAVPPTWEILKGQKNWWHCKPYKLSTTSHLHFPPTQPLWLSAPQGQNWGQQKNLLPSTAMGDERLYKNIKDSVLTLLCLQTSEMSLWFPLYHCSPNRKSSSAVRGSKTEITPSTSIPVEGLRAFIGLSLSLALRVSQIKIRILIKVLPRGDH